MKTQIACLAALVCLSVQSLVGQSAYQTLVSSQSPSSYFTFDNSLTDSVSGSLTLSVNGSTGAFATDLWGNTAGSRSFTSQDDGLSTSVDLISGGGSGPDANATGVGSVSFLFRTLDNTGNTGQRFVFAQGNVTTTVRNAFSMFFENQTNADPGSLKLRAGSATIPILQPAQIEANTWYYFAISYDEARNTSEMSWYVGPVGGTLVAGVHNPANDSVIGDNGSVHIGNRDGFSGGFRNPGSGQIDEFAVWNRELSFAEIQAQFAAVPEPSTWALLAMSSLALAGVRRRLSRKG